MSIKDHKWHDDDLTLHDAFRGHVDVGFTTGSSYISISREDTIALMKHFKLNETADLIAISNDLNELQKTIDDNDVRHFDEVAGLQAEIALLKQQLRNKEVN